MQATDSKAIAVQAAGSTVRASILALYAKGDTSAQSVARQRLTAYCKLFGSVTVEEVTAALSLSNARAEGIVKGSTAYIRLAECAPIYKLYASGKIDALDDGKSYCTAKGEVKPVANWRDMVDCARGILRAASEAKATAARVETAAAVIAHDKGKAANDPAVLKAAAATVQALAEAAEAKRESPQAKAGTFIRKAWADKERGREWAIAYARECVKVAEMLVLENPAAEGALAKQPKAADKGLSKQAAKTEATTQALPVDLQAQRNLLKAAAKQAAIMARAENGSKADDDKLAAMREAAQQQQAAG